LDDVRDHEQVQEDQCERAPPAGLRFTYAGFTVAREGDRGTGSSRNRSSSFQFLADTTTFHRVGEFTSKRAVRYRANGVAIARAAKPPNNRYRISQDFLYVAKLFMADTAIPFCALSESTNNPEEKTQC